MSHTERNNLCEFNVDGSDKYILEVKRYVLKMVDIKLSDVDVISETMFK